MAKLQPLITYIHRLKRRCTEKFGEDFVNENEDLIEATARNKRLLDRFDMELDDADLTVQMVGSTGQMKEDINPIIKHRNDIAKLYADNLEALQLTPRSKYKKSESRGSVEDRDSIAEYFGGIK